MSEKTTITVVSGPESGTAQEVCGMLEGVIVGFTTFSRPFRQVARLIRVEDSHVVFEAEISKQEIVVPHSEIELWPKPFDEDKYAIDEVKELISSLASNVDTLREQLREQTTNALKAIEALKK
ncbi:hypothetical protein LCGC14_1322650 [marine sediment metagenome]|uniref:Uncharacterized protein n=1 Tax=marine sediment metagenome TaxID=412755 RepID=A0A0F9NLD9_9ZZZZ